MNSTTDRAVPATLLAPLAFTPDAAGDLHCAICRRSFDFAAGETAAVLRHVAYGYDFVHEDGACLDQALATIFPEPGYDGAAFALDPERRRILAVADAAGWTAVAPEPPARVLAGQPVRFEPLRWWMLIEYQDGTRRVEGVTRDDEWLDEPGGASFPEADARRRFVGYAAPAEQADDARRAAWEARVRARHLGQEVPVDSEAPVSLPLAA
jgi:hypothetical protein